MKTIVHTCCVFAALLFCSPTNFLYGQCSNADFEMGDLSGWTGTWGDGSQRNVTIIGIPIPYCYYPDPYQHTGFNPGPLNSAPGFTPLVNHVITNSGNDLTLSALGYNLPVVYPGRGGYSARIGNAHADDLGHGGGESMTYSFTVTPNNVNFTYHYAAVLNDGGHPNTQQPYFNIRMYDGSNNPISCATYDVDANSASTIGGFIHPPLANNVWVKPWTSVFVPLNGYIGQTVRVEFSTRDCSPGVDSTVCIPITGPCFSFLNLLCEGSHWAYAYVDAECAPMQLIASSPAICGGQGITLTAPAGAATYAWTGPGVVPPTDSQTVTVTQPGTYQVTMTVLGQCSSTFTIDTVILSSPQNSQANFGAPAVCVGNPTAFTDLSTPAGTISNWAWDFDNNGTTDATTQNPSHTFAIAGTYPVKLTVGSSPCTDDTTINVTVSPAPTSTFIAPSPICTGVNDTITYTGNAPSGVTYTWNFDGGTIVSGTGQGPYVVNWSTAGVINVTLTVSAGSCVSSPTSVPVTVNLSPVVTVSADASICTGGSVVLTAGGAANLVWTPTTGLNPTTGTTVTANPSGTTTYIVTGSNAQCTDTASVTVTVGGMPTSTFTASPVCTGQNDTITYIGNAPSGATYNWNFGGGTVVSGSGQGPYAVNWSTPGTMTVTLTVAVGTCVSPPTDVQVVVDLSPNVTVSPDVTICTGGSTTLTAGGATNLVWFPTTGLNPTTGTTVTANPTSTTTYIVTGSNAQCTDTASVTVIVGGVPTSTFTATSPICAGVNDTITYTGNASAGATYTWNFDGGTVVSGSGQGPYSVNWSSAGVKNLTLTVDDNGCISLPTTVSVTVIASPVSNAGADVTYCSGATAVLGTASTAGYTYSWSPSSDLSSSTVSDPTVSLTNSTNAVITTNYTVTTTDNVCSSTDVVTVTVIPIPVASFSSPAGQCLTGNTFSFQAGGSFLPSATFAWDFGTNGNPATSTLQNQNVTFSSIGTQTVSLTISQNGCMSTYTDVVDVYPVPVVDFTADTLIGCENFPVCFTDNSVSNNLSTYAWDFGNGAVSSLQNPCFTFVAPGTYTISLQVTSADGCSASSAIPNMITVIANPIAAFTGGSGTYFYGAAINLQNQSQYATSYFWTFGNGTTSTLVNPSVTYPAPGSYTVTLDAYNQLGCVDSAQDEITVFEPESFFIPNVFTPNGDGSNDVFNIQTKGNVQVFEFEVFNRWGEKVHENLYSWDGTFKGKQVPPAVYVYVFKLGLTGDTRSLIRKGSVTLIR